MLPLGPAFRLGACACSLVTIVTTTTTAAELPQFEPPLPVLSDMSDFTPNAEHRNAAMATDGDGTFVSARSPRQRVPPDILDGIQLRFGDIGQVLHRLAKLGLFALDAIEEILAAALIEAKIASCAAVPSEPPRYRARTSWLLASDAGISAPAPARRRRRIEASHRCQRWR
ncbi:MAG TPA: hypothetical protein VEL28_11830 [Candidatus Binatia bacterium]|nr:hypothetical protein [Candidatus Binatia bacterium]